MRRLGPLLPGIEAARGDPEGPTALGDGVFGLLRRDPGKDAHGRAWTSICTRTIQFDKAEDIIRTLGTPSFKLHAANP
jgi:hypothetical protein